MQLMDGVLGQRRRVAPVSRRGGSFKFNQGVVGPGLQLIQLAVIPIQKIWISRGL